jgi:hypothetical protein
MQHKGLSRGCDLFLHAGRARNTLRSLPLTLIWIRRVLLSARTTAVDSSRGFSGTTPVRQRSSSGLPSWSAPVYDKFVLICRRVFQICKLFNKKKKCELVNMLFFIHLECRRDKWHGLCIIQDDKKRFNQPLNKFYRRGTEIEETGKKTKYTVK